jgi:2,4-dienoyl-CoA reductase-like NADH-dependent reductase (Old Yellow Enzyme family)
MKNSKIFEKMELAPGLVLRNRIAMAPMTTWASNDDGTVSNEEEAYYRRRSNDVGMVITGCTHVQANGVGFTGEFAAHDDRFIPSLTKLALAAKSGGAAAILQIFHAGVKTLPALVSDVVAASEVASEAGPFAPAVMPRALRDEEILMVIEAFADATRRAIAAGFDGVELHGAHGFLIQNFFSPHSNRRRDRWGGSLENRMRFPLAVVEAVQRTIDEHADRPFALGYRISVEESVNGGLQIADSLHLINRLIEARVSYIHASLGSALDQKPQTGSDDTTVISMLHKHINGRVPLIAAGRIKTPDQAEMAIEMGLSLAAVGQSLVINPDWLAHARSKRANEIDLSLSADDVSRACIPQKLWGIIEAMPGWFDVAPKKAEAPAQQHRSAPQDR